MKDDLQNLDTATIVDMLAQKTERYTQLLSEKMLNEEYEELKKTIELIQEELTLRHQSNDSNPDIRFEEPDSTL